jgi:alanine racemase
VAEPARARLTIDLGALADNYHLLEREAGGAGLAPVLKADGYGLGVRPVARRLWTEGARRFFIARLEEGEDLRQALGPERPAEIYVLDGLPDGAGPRMSASDLIPVISSRGQVAAAGAWAAASGRPLNVALQVDTGMNRQGMTREEVRALDQDGGRLHGLDVGLIMSHLGSASDPDNSRNANQLARFLEVRRLYPQARASLAATSGIFLGEAYRFDLVRPGIGLFGGGPLEVPDARFKPVAVLEAPVVDIRPIEAGQTVGYGSAVVVQAPMRAAVIGAGYADGFIRAARGTGQVWLSGALRPVLSITMDLMIVDVGKAAVSVGDMAELLGPHVLLDDLAVAAGSVPHEVLVRLSRRAERVYLDETA